jgi:RNA polymerase sigma factor for flagellar operon FliA
MTARNLRTWESPFHLDPSGLEAAWQQYRRTRDDKDRNTLLEHYLPLAKAQSLLFHRRLPGEVELDDVTGAAVEGLRLAVRGYDPGVGVRFETYCSSRIRGAIMDLLRSTDRLPRLMRARTSHLNRCREELTSAVGRPPADEEVAAYMGVSAEKFGDFALAAGAAKIKSLDAPIAEDADGRATSAATLTADPHAEKPWADAQHRDLRTVLTRGLSKTERLIMILYYYEELTMKEIGATLDLSESRVSQVHSAVLERLERKMDGRRREFLP